MGVDILDLADWERGGGEAPFYLSFCFDETAATTAVEGYDRHGLQVPGTTYTLSWLMKTHTLYTSLRIPVTLNERTRLLRADINLGPRIWVFRLVDCIVCRDQA